MLLLDIKRLQDNIKYWEETYGYRLKTNIKRGEKWGSAFIPVPVGDKELQKCAIDSLEDLTASFL